MKKIIFLLFVALAGSQVAKAQIQYSTNRAAQKKAWLDLQQPQRFGLNKWSDTPWVNDGYYRAASTELRLTGNLYLAPQAFGIFLDLGLGTASAPRMRTPDLATAPALILPDNSQYFLREAFDNYGSDGSGATFRISAGFFGDIKLDDRMSIMPYLGIGTMVMPAANYRMVIKENGSNMQYDSAFSWTNDYSDFSAGIVNLKVNLRYKVRPRLSLLVGAEYTALLHWADFTASHTNSFNTSLYKDIIVEGNRMNMFGLSVGLSFR